MDWKTSLQELAAERGLGSPEYVVVESGPDHQKSFRATVMLGELGVGSGRGNSKKEAEQYAAEQAWTVLSAQSSDSTQSAESVVPVEPAE